MQKAGGEGGWKGKREMSKYRREGQRGEREAE